MPSKILELNLNRGGSGMGVSLLTTASFCGRRANLDKQGYEEKGEKEDAHVGTIYHALQEEYHKTGESDIIVQASGTTEDSVQAEAQRLFRFYTSQFSPRDLGTVLGVEVQVPFGDAEEHAIAQEFGVPIGGLTGRLDLVVEMNQERVDFWRGKGLDLDGPGIYIVDWKTMRAKRSNLELEQSLRLQFSTYPMLLKIADRSWALDAKPVLGTIASNMIRHKQLKRGESLSWNYVPAPTKEQEPIVKNWIKLAYSRYVENLCNPAYCTEGYGICQHLLEGRCQRV